MRQHRIWRTALIGVVCAGAFFAASSTFAAALDEETFEACREAKADAASATARQAKRAAKAFKRLDAKRARKEIGSALADAESKKERRAAFKKAVAFCAKQKAYAKTAIVVPSQVDVADTTTATVTGTATPGAVITYGTASGTADPSGAFAIVISGLGPGDNRIRLRAESDLRYPSTRPVNIVVSESEAAFKASAGTIAYDELIKDPNALIGRRIYSRAQVFQYDTRTGTDALLVSVTQMQPGEFEFWTDQVFLQLSDAALGTGIDNNDVIEFWGTVTGAYSYDTAAGGTNSVPAVEVTYLSLLEKREEQ